MLLDCQSSVFRANKVGHARTSQQECLIASISPLHSFDTSDNKFVVYLLENIPRDFFFVHDKYLYSIERGVTPNKYEQFKLCDLIHVASVVYP